MTGKPFQTHIVVLWLLIALASPSHASNWWSSWLTSANNNLSADTGDPVAASSGSYYFSVPLLNPGGPLPLEYELRYRMNQFASQSLTSSFQSNTDVLLERGLTPNEEPAVDVHLRNGEKLTFIYDEAGGEWRLDDAADIRYSLLETGSNETEGYYYLMDPVRSRVYILEKTTPWGEARILRVTDRNGNRHDYTYTGARTSPDSVSDGLGRSLTFTRWLESDWVSRVTDQSGRSVSIGYERNAPDYNNRTVLRSTTDAEGHVTTYHYGFLDSMGAPILRVQRPMGNAPYTQTAAMVEFNGETDARVTSQSDAYGATSALSYNAAANQVTITRPDGATEMYEHFHNQGLPRSYTDAAAGAAAYQQTVHQQMSRFIDRRGGVHGFTYHAPTGAIASVTDAEGSVTTFTYASQDQTFTNPANGETATFRFHNLIRIDHADGTFEQFTHDDRGNVLTHRNRSGKSWSFSYNGRGQVLRRANPAGGIVVYTYNADATLGARQDPETGVTRYGYDPMKRLNQITHPDGGAVEFTYDDNDRITGIIDERDNDLSFTYDANGNTVEAVDAKGNRIRYAHDLMDRLTGVTDRRGGTTTLTYDELNRMDSITDPNGIQIQYGYDPRGWVNRLAIGGDAWRMQYDNEGALISLTTPLGNTTTFRRNSVGRITRITDPLANRIDFMRDALQRVTRITDPRNQTAVFAHNGWDALESATAPVIGAASYPRDDLGRLSRLVDPNAEVWQFVHSDMGRILSSADPLGGAQTFTYNNRGRVSARAYADGGVQELTYDAAGNLLQRACDGGPTLDYSYDADLNRLRTAADIGFTYDAEGAVLTTVQGDVTFSAAHDAGGRLASVTYDAFTVAYTYDETTGLLSRVEDNLTNSWLELAYDADRKLIAARRSNGVDSTYTYDAASRLTRIRHGSHGDLKYTLDAAGQVTRVDMDAPLDPEDFLTEDVAVYNFDGANQVMNAGWEYDPRGRCTADPTRRFAWDKIGRLVGVGDAALAYNGLGDLIRRTSGREAGRGVGDNVRSYYYNYAIAPAPIMAERRGSDGAWLKYYVYTPEGRLLYMIDAADDNRVYHYHFDRAGSTLFLTDAVAEVTDAYAYTPYGEMLSHQGSTEQPFTFVGQWGVRQEGENGRLYHMRARYYDAITHHFLSRDPLWPALVNVRQLNPYQYARQNPLSFIDPSGLEPQTPFQMSGDPGTSFGRMTNLAYYWSGIGFDDMIDLADRFDHAPPADDSSIPDFTPFARQDLLLSPWRILGAIGEPFDFDLNWFANSMSGEWSLGSDEMDLSNWTKIHDLLYADCSEDSEDNKRESLLDRLKIDELRIEDIDKYGRLPDYERYRLSDMFLGIPHTEQRENQIRQWIREAEGQAFNSISDGL